MFDFLALGNLTLDDVITADGQIALKQLGGAGVYAAAGVRLWGESVGLISVVGSDFPEEYIDTLAQSGIDVSGIERLNIPHGLRSRAFYFQDGSRTDRMDEVAIRLPPDVKTILSSETRYTDYGSPEHRNAWPLFSPSPTQIKSQHLDARFAHLAPGPIRNNRKNAQFLKQRTAGQIMLTLDWPWWDYSDPTHIDAKLLRAIDFLLPSREDLVMQSSLLDEKALFAAAVQLLSYELDGVVIKQGIQGAHAFAAEWEGGKHIPIYATESVDPTGAGDAFCGGFLVGMARTGDIIQAAGYGAVSASFMIEDFGVVHALQVTADQVEARLERYQAGLTSSHPKHLEVSE
jgi:ribokinase